MCSHYEGVRDREKFRRHFRAEPPHDMGKHDVWPGYSACFIRRHEHVAVGDEAVPERETLVGLFGMVPHWSQDTKIAHHTYNARTETVAEKPSFRDAWRHGRHCIIPADAFYEPDWRSGRAIPTRISLAGDEPMGIAGLWSAWKAPHGETVFSFTMLTINADAHPLMKSFHKPTDEKRMVVILPASSYEHWLRASPLDSMDFMQPYPAEQMLAVSASMARPLF